MDRARVRSPTGTTVATVGAMLRSASLTSVAAAQSRTVLLVDAEPDLLLTLALNLEDSFPVRTTTDPFEALSLLRTEAIGLVVTDLHLPAMTGVQLIRHAQAIHPGVLAIFLSGRCLEPHEVSAVAKLRCVQGRIEKPVVERSMRALRELIGRAFDHRALRD